MEKIEYRVRPVTRFVVTRYEDRENSTQGSNALGEFDSFDTAMEVGYALCKAEHGRLGWPVGDERISYPDALWLRHAPPTDNPNADALEDKAFLYGKMSDELRAMAAQSRYEHEHGPMKLAAKS